MGLVSFIQKHNENEERRRRNDIEQQKVNTMRAQQQINLKYCPHCGKPLP